MELEQKLGARSVRHLWVDPSRDFVMVRSLTVSHGNPVSKTDIRYRREEACGWVPDEWETVTQGPGSERRVSRRVQVTKHHFNEPMDAAQFDLSFPPGTRVRDRKNDLDFLVTPGGGKRVIPQAERHLPYEKLLATASTGVLGSERGGSFLVASALGIGLAALGLLVYRRVVRREKFLP